MCEASAFNYEYSELSFEYLLTEFRGVFAKLLTLQNWVRSIQNWALCTQSWILSSQIWMSRLRPPSMSIQNWVSSTYDWVLERTAIRSLWIPFVSSASWGASQHAIMPRLHLSFVYYGRGSPNQSKKLFPVRDVQVTKQFDCWRNCHCYCKDLLFLSNDSIWHSLWIDSIRHFPHCIEILLHCLFVAWSYKWSGAHLSTIFGCHRQIRERLEIKYGLEKREKARRRTLW